MIKIKNAQFVDILYYHKQKSVSKAVVKDITKNRKNVFHVKKIVLNVQTDLIVKNVKDLRTYIKEIVFHLVQNIGHQSHKFVKKMDLQIIVI